MLWLQRFAMYVDEFEWWQQQSTQHIWSIYYIDEENVWYIKLSCNWTELNSAGWFKIRLLETKKLQKKNYYFLKLH